MMQTMWRNLQDILGYEPGNPLLFTNLDFWLFFLVLAAGLLLVLRRIRLRTFYLLGFSLFFYYKSCGFFFVLILFSILFNYGAAWAIARSKARRLARSVLFVSVGVNLGLLAYFKYQGFLIGLLNEYLGTNFQPTNALGSALEIIFGSGGSLTDVILPVGISFYTFQAISYVVDVYRGQLRPLRRISDFGFYLSFFPQLVAGPIVRAQEFIPQISRPYLVSRREAAHALFLILSGLVKKIVLSDYVALNLVDRVFDNPVAYSSVENLLAMYGYALQIYCDFSGYTDIAIGVALLLGFRLSINFNFPYRALNLTDFWRRWHISLSSWLRDYLYIPLGGSRHGRGRMYFALLATMLLGGMWHGASLTFLFWGLAHGLGLVVGKWLDRLPGRILFHPAFRAVRAFLTFQFVCVLWVFFRAPTFEGALALLGRFGDGCTLGLLAEVLLAYWRPVLLICLGFALHWLPRRAVEIVRGSFISAPVVVRFALALALVLILLQVQSAGMQPFIYFDF